MEQQKPEQATNRTSSTLSAEDEEIFEKEYDPNSVERICCVELPNNNLVYIRYEEGWTIKNLINSVIEHKEFKTLYQDRNWIMNSKSRLPLFDLLMAFYRRIKPKHEIRIDYDLELDNLHREGLLKNHKHRLFIFTDNRVSSNLLYKYSELIKNSNKKIEDSNYDYYSFYDLYLPRINTNNFVDNHPEVLQYFQNKKNSLNNIKRFYLNPLISDKNEALDWFIYDDESFKFLMEMQKTKIDILSNIKLIDDKIYFEDTCEPTRLTEDDLDKCFVNLTISLDGSGDNINVMTKKFKITLKTTGYDLLESMNKKIQIMKSELVFQPENKILKVNSLNDYIFNIKLPLINFTYLNECLKLNKDPEYSIIDNPLLQKDAKEYNIQENQNQINSKKFVTKDSFGEQKNFFNRNHHDDLMNVATYKKPENENNANVNWLNKAPNNNKVEKGDKLFDFMKEITQEINNDFKKSCQTKNSGVVEKTEDIIDLINNDIDTSNIISEKFSKSSFNSFAPNLNVYTFLNNNKKNYKEKNNQIKSINVFKNEETKKCINLKDKLNKLYLHISIKNINRPFSILLKNAKLDDFYNSFPVDKGTVLLFRVQICCGYQEFSKPKQIKWTNKSGDMNPLFNKRIYFETDFDSIPNFASILFKVKFIQYDKSNEIINSKSIGWANFKIFDSNKKLRSGTHKISLFKRNFGDDAYFCFTDNNEDDSIDIYFEIDSFIKPVTNKDTKIINYNRNIKKFNIDKNNMLKINKILQKNPFDELNNYEKDILWTNRYSIPTMTSILSKLVQSVDNSNPRHLIELAKVFNLTPNLTVVQALELLSGTHLNSSVRDFAVKCLKKASNLDLENYLLQMVQGLKYEMVHDSELARFLIEIGVKYPMTIGHSLFWLLRSEMYNQNVQQRFGIYLEVFLNKIGSVLGGIFEDENFLVKNLLKIAEIPKGNYKKQEKDQLFMEALEKFNHEIIKANKIISIPLNFKFRVKGLDLSKCKYMKSKKKPMWLVFKSDDPLGKDLIVMFKKGDDLRMDIVTMQLFKAMQSMWFEHKIKLKMSLYGVMSTGLNHGMLEMVTDSVTLAAIHVQEGGAIQTLFSKSSIKNWLNDNSLLPVDAYTENFMLSSVAYCIATFVLGIGDRHNDNIMIKKNGEVFHIDFGHFLGHFKYKMGIKRERAPFVFTKQFQNVLGDENGASYKTFKELLVQAYQLLRTNSQSLVTLLRILLCTAIPELDIKSIRFLEHSLALKLSDDQAKTFLDNALNDAINSVSTKFNFAIHIVANK